MALIRIIASGRRIPGLPETFDIAIRPDFDVLLFTSVVAVITGVLFGLAPALRAIAAKPAGSLRSAGRSGETRGARRFASSLVVAQLALSLLLVSVAGQFVQHLASLRDHVGFSRHNLLLLTLNPAGSGLSGRQLSIRYRDLLDRLQAIPGVLSATLCGPTPVSGAGASRFVIVDGHAENPQKRRYVSLAWVAPRYFETLQIPLRAGRDFAFEDQGRPRVAIINQSMARFNFGDQSPIGRQVQIDRDARTGGWYGGDDPYEIVGVAADSAYQEPGEIPHRTLYFNAFQEDRIQSNLAVRTGASSPGVAAAVRHEISRMGSGISLERVTTMAAQVDASLVSERLIATLSGAFGILGALLAAIGLYGLLAYIVSRRTHEIGVRIALGATQSDTRSLVLKSAIKMIVLGLALGLPAAMWGRKAVVHTVGNLTAGNELPILAAMLALAAAGLIAAYFPLRRALGIAPVDALRCE